ncbi:pyridoxal 5'-phosphate synthase glutaminase subunit PdxT [Halanaerobaculum tunisiense]
MVKIGVLSFQGGVTEHLNLLDQIPDVTPLAVKKKKDFSTLDGLILPGGESTTINKLLNIFGLQETIIQLAQQGIPIWGTCAGMILLADRLTSGPGYLRLMDITVKRNAYGNQLDSFKTKTQIPKLTDKKIPLVFIRAPYVTQVGPQVEVLLQLQDQIVAIEEDNLLATSFHPELATDLTIHRYFVEKVKKSI